MGSARSKPAVDDDHTGQHGGQEAVEVGQDVLEGALDVEAGAIGPGQPPGGRQVDDDPDAAVITTTARPCTACGWISRRIATEGQDGRHHQQGDPVAGRGQDLGPLEAERPRPCGRPGRQVQGPQGGAEGAGVDEHVAGVGEQRQRVGRGSDHHLGDHEPDDQDQSQHQVTLVRPGVRVDVVVHGAETTGYGPRRARPAARCLTRGRAPPPRGRPVTP